MIFFFFLKLQLTLCARQFLFKYLFVYLQFLVDISPVGLFRLIISLVLKMSCNIDHGRFQAIFTIIFYGWTMLAREYVKYPFSVLRLLWGQWQIYLIRWLTEWQIFIFIFYFEKVQQINRLVLFQEKINDFII